MTVTDLRARDFRRYATLPKAYTWCLQCSRYRWFGWWQAPDRLQVAACDTCGTLQPFEATCATRYPVRDHAQT